VLGQLSYRPVALDGGKRHLALKAGVWSGAVVCSWSLLFAAIIAAVRQKFQLIDLSNLRVRL